MADNGTRYCPFCNSTDVMITFEPFPFDERIMTICCKLCSRELEIEKRNSTWVDPEWEQSGHHQ